MSHVPHELAEEFPDHTAALSQLRQTDKHFLKISDTYHVLNRAIHRAETEVEPTSDQHLTDMRKERLALLDEIYATLKAQAA